MFVYSAFYLLNNKHIVFFSNVNVIGQRHIKGIRSQRLSFISEEKG